MWSIDMKYKRWMLPVLIGLLLFGNHYTRDSLGALEKQFEHEYHFTDQEYANINSLYFFPNMITPLLAGMLTEKFGGVSICFLYSLFVASAGHLLFALGIQFKSKLLIFFGRGLAGSVYEIVDAFMPIAYLSPLFAKEFQLVVGFMQIFIRMGSVANFIISPYLFTHYNVKVAFWVSSLIGIASVPLFLWSRQVEVEYNQHRLNEELAEQIKAGVSLPHTNSDDEGHYGSSKKEIELASPSSIANNQLSSKSSGSTGGSNGSSRNTSVSTFTISDAEEDEEEANTRGATAVFSPLSSLATDTEDSDNITNTHKQQQKLDWWSQTKANFLSVMPLDQFSYRFYMYLYCGSLLYGAIVPFWFTGSKYLQDRLRIDVSFADTLVSLPEMMVILVGFPIGLIVTKYQWSLPVKLGGVCLSMSGMTLAYTLLVTSASAFSQPQTGHNHSAVALATVAVLLLGVSFSFACSLFWGAINDVIGTTGHHSAGNGLICCGVNILPTLVPPILALFVSGGDSGSSGSSNASVIVLGSMSFLSAVCAMLSAYPHYVEQLMSLISSKNSGNSSDGVGGGVGGVSYAQLDVSEHNGGAGV